MTAAILTTLLMLAVGVPIANALPGAPRRASSFIGESYLLGSAACGFALMALSLFGVRWSVASLLVVAALIALLAVAVRREVPRLEWSRPSIIDALTLALVAGYAKYATLASPVEADYLFIWGSKAKRFWIARGIDWPFLAQPPDVLSHPGYPILTPLIYDAHALIAGEWPEQWIGVTMIASGVAGLLVVRGFLAESMSRTARAIATAILMPLIFSPYIGLAEGPLIACAVAAALYLRSAGVSSAGPQASRLRPRGGEDAARPAGEDAGAPLALRGAVFLGIAASHKDEGLALLIAAAIALLITRAWALLPRLWPALAIIAPWTILKQIHGLPDDVASGGIGRLIARLDDPAAVLRIVASYRVGQFLFWIALLLAFAIAARRMLTAERFLLALIAMHLVLAIVAYFMTPYDLVWQIRWSWERVVRQMMPLMALAALFAVSAPSAQRTSA